MRRRKFALKKSRFRSQMSIIRNTGKNASIAQFSVMLAP